MLAENAAMLESSKALGGEPTGEEHDRPCSAASGEPGSPDLDDWADQALGPGTG